MIKYNKKAGTRNLVATELRDSPSSDFGRIKTGTKTLEDATLIQGDLAKANSQYGSIDYIMRAITNKEYENMRSISQHYYTISGIYKRLVRYLAYMYRYDWLVTPYINSESIGEDKILKMFSEILTFLDNSNIKQLFGEIALKVVKNGVYYGFRVESKDRVIIQELAPKYCRSRFKTAEGRSAVEFDMRYFEDMFFDTEQRMKMLNLFPDDFKRGYVLYKKGRIPPAFMGDSPSWYLLDTDCAVKFSLNDEDFPTLLSVIPAIVRLDNAQALDRKKMQQELMKILIQKLPVDKNGDLVFDIEEAKVLHNNAVQMLGRAIGIDVLTTFADVSVEDMIENRAATAKDDLEKSERAVYNEAGISQLQFNTDGNIALEKSILNDEASMYNLIQQFESFLNSVIKKFNKNKKITFRVQILGTTIYNYKELAKIYKEQTQIGYSKILPQLALGQSQSSILANAHFENEILDLVNVFIPPMSSNTTSAKDIQEKNNSTKKASSGEEGGRPEKQDDEKTEKTIMNKESMN